MVEAFQLLFH